MSITDLFVVQYWIEIYEHIPFADLHRFGLNFANWFRGGLLHEIEMGGVQ